MTSLTSWHSYTNVWRVNLTFSKYHWNRKRFPCVSRIELYGNTSEVLENEKCCGTCCGNTSHRLVPFPQQFRVLPCKLFHECYYENTGKTFSIVFIACVASVPWPTSRPPPPPRTSMFLLLPQFSRGQNAEKLFDRGKSSSLERLLRRLLYLWNKSTTQFSMFPSELWYKWLWAGAYHPGASICAD